MKRKLQDWYDRAYYAVTHLSVKEFWYIVKRWLSYFKVLRKIYDYDYSSILAVERYQLTRVRDAIVKYKIHLEWERDVDRMNLALKLLDIIEEDGHAELIGKGFTIELYKDGIYKLVDNPDSKWILPIYVNTSNSQRFTSIDKSRYEDKRVGPLYKDQLRVEKAWHLYHNLRKYYMRSWWD